MSNFNPPRLKKQPLHDVSVVRQPLLSLSGDHDDESSSNTSQNRPRRSPTYQKPFIIFIGVGLLVFMLTTYQRQLTELQSETVQYDANVHRTNVHDPSPTASPLLTTAQPIPSLRADTSKLSEGDLVGTTSAGKEEIVQQDKVGNSQSSYLVDVPEVEAISTTQPTDAPVGASTTTAEGEDEGTSSGSVNSPQEETLPSDGTTSHVTSALDTFEIENSSTITAQQVVTTPTANHETSESATANDATIRATLVPHIVPDDNPFAEDMDVTDRGIPLSMKPPVDCGCPKLCDAVALSRTNLAFGCLKRIQFFMSSYKLNETKACMSASRDKEPCGLECHPLHCHNESVFQPTPFNWTRVVSVDRPPQPFVRYDKVVVATKVLWPNDMFKLKQMLCLFTAAYNRHVNYDIVVFSTVPWTRWQVQELQSVIPETKLMVVRDSPPLQDQLATMSPEELAFLYNRCDVKEGENITWFHHCTEPGFKSAANLGYSWQAEFRSYHIWKTPVLADYKYMIWMDGDSFCTKPWLQDPMKAMVENDLVLMVDNFPQGSAVNPKLKDKLLKAYNRSICSLYMSANGTFRPKECAPEQSPKIGLVHGFHHITNLDFYRSPTNLRFLELMVSDHRFSREWDDQLAVTAPAAMLAPNRAWGLRHHGFKLQIHHNGQLDGKERNIATRYTKFWELAGRKNWKAGREMCDAVVVYGD